MCRRKENMDISSDPDIIFKLNAIIPNHPHVSEGRICGHPGMQSLQLQSRLDDIVQSSRQNAKKNLLSNKDDRHVGFYDLFLCYYTVL